MSKIIICPAGNKLAKEHFVNTIEHTVSIEKLSDYLNDKDLNFLKDVSPNGTNVWGVTPGDNMVNKTRWDKMIKGDTVLFSGGDKIYASGVVIHKIQNRNLGLDLWGLDLRGRAWEYIFFLNEIKTLDIPLLTFNRASGDDDKNNNQSFRVIDEVRSSNIFQTLNLLSNTHLPDVEQNEYERFKELGIHYPWWINDSEEKYWFEFVKSGFREDSSGNPQLVAPHFSPFNASKRIYRYSLVNFVKQGDVIYHYISKTRSIVGYSHAKGDSYDSMDLWHSERVSTEENNKKVPVFVVDLIDYIPFENPVTLDDLRDKQNELMDYLNNNPHIKYTPFHKGRNIFSEGYLSKFPKEFHRILNLNYHKGKFSLEAKKRLQKTINSYNKKRKRKVDIIENPYAGKIPNAKEPDSNPATKKVMTFPEFDLEQRFVKYMENIGLECTQLRIGSLENDLYINEKDLLIEVKGTTKDEALRMVIGQIKHYDYLLSKDSRKPKYVATLLPEKPSEDFINILSNEKIYMIWETEEGIFKDNFTSNFFK